jgi:histidine ammonia-lyase
LGKFGWEPIRLQSKEGLALLNGTQFCQAYGVWCLLQASRICEAANLTAALSLDAFDCRLSPFNQLLHHIRPHHGQLAVAAAIRNLLAGSQIALREKIAVQDPYAFRCVPQVHGASLDAIAHVEQVFATEINAVTDNPTIFPDDDEILSGGNFHAQPLALALDYLAIALAELGSISERRTYQLIGGQRGLPTFLSKNGGLNSGLMIPQYTAASIVSQTKQLCTPASVDSIVSSNGQEDHVSMGANAATKAWRIVENVWRVLAIEFFTAAQAMEFRRPLRSSEALESVLADYRKVVPVVEDDRILSGDMEATVAFLKTMDL